MYLRSPAQPLRIMSTLGVRLLDWSFVMGGNDLAAPRLFAHVGAYAASAGMLAWLLLRGISPWVSLVCSLALAWDPAFAQSYRGCRLDAWTIALGVGTVAFVALAARQRRGTVKRALCLIASGLALGAAGMVWVSAVLLIPLVCESVVAGSESQESISLRLWACVKDLSVVGAATAAFAAAWLWLAAGDLPQRIADYRIHAGMLAGVKWSIPSLLTSFRVTPLLPIVAAVAATVRFGVNRSSISALVAAALGVMATGAYVYRAIYLIPYLLLIISLTAQALMTNPGRSTAARRLVSATLACLVIASGVVTVGVRNVIALRERELRDPDQWTVSLQQLIGDGPHKVYLATPQLYYAARTLGWRYRGSGCEEGCRTCGEALADIDVVIAERRQSRTLGDCLRDEGFAEIATLCEEDPAENVPARQPSGPYGPYVIYRKVK